MTVTLFEYEATEGFAWTPRVRRAAECLHAAGLLDLVVRKGCVELRATQHVGVFRLAGQTVQVLPKIYRHHALAREEATRNLLHLLAFAGHLPVREQDVAQLLRRDRDWFEILTRLFARHLREEWQRGPVRRYVAMEEDLPVLKGRWRIGDQLRRPTQKHLFAVTYDQFTADNPLNRVLRFVVERLWRITRDADNRQLLGELREWMGGEVTLVPALSATDATSTLLDRLHRRYTPLLELARLFLEGGSIQLHAGERDSLDTFAFAFDMNRLFEGFVIGFLRRYREAILPRTLSGCELLPQSLHATRYLARTQGRDVFTLRPDLAFREGKQFPLLLDAKYKRLDGEDARLGVSQADFYQMFAYAHRYDCPRVLLLYPQTAELAEPLHRRFFLLGGDRTVTVATLDVRQDLGRPVGRQALLEELQAIFQEVITDDGRAD